MKWIGQKVHCKVFIEQLLYEFNKILLISDSFKIALTQDVLESMNLEKQNVLIFSTERRDIVEKHLLHREISKELVEQLGLLYHTYEFADNFILLEESSTFATVFNYVQTGLLTPEEAWQALLGE